MGDSERPKRVAPEFEVPDLDLDLPNKGRRANALLEVSLSAYSGTRLFDDDAFTSGSNVDSSRSSEPAAAWGAPRAWPSGRAPQRAELALDPVQIAVVADYGEPPRSVHATPSYAYRVFTRQRQLKRTLAELELESARAEAERQGVLAELALALRPGLAEHASFRGLLADLGEAEQVADQLSHALSSVNAQLGQRTAELDAESSAESARAAADESAVRDAQTERDERADLARRADAKLKRVQIEIRGLSSAAEQKHAQPHSAALATFQRRAEALLLELNQAKVALKQAELSLSQSKARLPSARERAEQVARKKQALLEHFQPEIAVRARGLRESGEQRRIELAHLACSVLALQGAVPVPEPWLSRVKVACDRADDLLSNCELHARALEAYDHERVARGVRLSCTAVALVIFLLVLKLAL